MIMYRYNMRANQHWLFTPEVSPDPGMRRHSIQNYLSKFYLDIKGGELVQTANSQPVWELRKKHDFSGELFHLIEKKYLVKTNESELDFSDKNG